MLLALLTLLTLFTLSTLLTLFTLLALLSPFSQLILLTLRTLPTHWHICLLILLFCCSTGVIMKTRAPAVLIRRGEKLNCEKRSDQIEIKRCKNLALTL